MDHSINGPQALGNTDSEWVWFEGATALLEGQGVCYNWDYGTAADATAARYNRVELPSNTNNLHFAGVAARNYSAKAGGQLIEIYRPGSVCKVLAKFNATIGVGILTCQAGGTEAGYFTRKGFQGAGSAVPLQTVDRSTTAGTVLAKLQEGEQSGLIEVITPAAAGGAHQAMVGGVTYVSGTVTLAAAATSTLADGAIPGQKKGFYCEGTYTTSDYEVTVTSGSQRTVETTGGTPLALVKVSLDAAKEEIYLVWAAFGADGKWVEQFSVGATLAAS